ncbi:response regulator [Gloeocapsopsis dulcis]|uniref:Two-component system response regulator n=1 Tax=Gloeocapsopsis dulcis AAB1 = 1H9 TaxID=1433147 RepID=A0A6N8FW12_9CHRO|nr:response regulator transcription factor [Gloeocapsopsis dulcis]MUL36357.1 two-component system response regulator [Gloeocapsopsis dulcis AAB1 = 1H9]WNN88147.1 response regulator transcription factor [Gloeocapsopsis dulcis]
MIPLACQSGTLRVLVADDHELTRFSLKLALANQENIELVGLASNGLEAIEMVQRHHPDVIILDLQMPIMDGLSASNQIKNIAPGTQIIAYSSLEEPKLRETNQLNNMDAFCRKDTSTPELIALVRQLGNRSIE